MTAAPVRSGGTRTPNATVGLLTAGMAHSSTPKNGTVMPAARFPALMVASRVGVGWTLNLANPAAWLDIATVAAVPAGLAAIAAAAGM